MRTEDIVFGLFLIACIGVIAAAETVTRRIKERQYRPPNAPESHVIVTHRQVQMWEQHPYDHEAE